MRKSKKYTLLALVVILAVVCAGYIGLQVNGKTVEKANLSTDIYKVSKGLYTGKGYQLNYEQQKKLEDNEKKKQQKEERQQKEDRQEDKKNPYKNNRTDINQQLNRAIIDNGKPGPVVSGEANPTEGGKDESKDNVKPDKPEEPKPEETDPSLLPTISTNLIDGKTYPDCFAPFYVIARDQRGVLLTGYLGRVTVTVNGVEDSGATKRDSDGNDVGRNYQIDLQEGKNVIVITAVDKDGHSLTKSYTVYGDKNAPIPDSETATVYFSLNLSNLGIDSHKYDRTMVVRDGELISRALEKYLASIGVTPTSRGGTYGYYLSGICGNNLFKGMRLTKEQVENIDRDAGFTLDFAHGEKVDDDGYIILNNGYNCLSEKEITRSSGWMFKYNGKVVGFGLSNGEVHDGDLVELFWTNNLGWDANGGWDPEAGT